MIWQQLQTYAQCGFQQAAAAFDERPSADNYSNLIRAAIVHQQVRVCPAERRQHVLNVVLGKTIRELPATLVYECTGGQYTLEQLALGA